MNESFLALTLAGILSWIVGHLVDLARRQRGSRRPPEQLPPRDEVVVFRPRRQARAPRIRLPTPPFVRDETLASTQYRPPTKCRICDHPFDHRVHLAHVQS